MIYYYFLQGILGYWRKVTLLPEDVTSLSGVLCYETMLQFLVSSLSVMVCLPTPASKINLCGRVVAVGLAYVPVFSSAYNPV